MNITPTTPATFYGFNDQLISIPLISLSAYVVALRGIVKHGADLTGKDIEGRVRALLEAPDDYAIVDIYDHLDDALEETERHYGVI
jgi:hypothetical protein